MVELAVADTGVGIAADELPHIFQRFHRVRGAEGRTHEGTGIGLALVSELVRLHDGVVRVESESGRGSTFTVCVPTGSRHLPQERIGATPSLTSTAVGAAPFVEEALRWLPESSAAVAAPLTDAPLTGVTNLGATVLVADDNADMRAYLARLLRQYWEVEVAADGEEALRAIKRRRPDLVLSDVMMPRLDGVGLTHALRSDPDLRSLPVILLSARAGEESRVEGLGAGADDYLTKPFSARELLARVSAALELARVRREALQTQAMLMDELRAESALTAAANEALKEADRRKDEFLAMLGHELRNPLSAVRNAVATASLDDNRRSRALEIARRQTEQLGRLIDDLLDVARITQGRISLRKEPMYLAEILERAIENTKSFIESRGVDLDVSIPASPTRLEADAARLEQVFVNLLANAGKYTERGGRIVIQTMMEPHEVVVSIRDTGIGIAPEMLSRMWNLFAQGDRSLDRSQGGLGVGLTISRRLVELHGGELTARSEGINKGAEFIVRLPALAEPAGDITVSPDPRLPLPSRHARILIVEDNPDAAESLVMILELIGHRVRVVHDGVAGLDAARANPPDLMLIDIGLPGIDGYEVARRIRRDPALKHLVLVALTGYGRDEDKERAIAAGFDYHLVKPVDLSQLGELVSRLGGAADGESTVH
jgi:signal transduction histidine kinase